MGNKLSPIDEVNKQFGDSGFRLVPLLDENREQIGYDVEWQHSHYKIPTLDIHYAATLAKVHFDGARRALSRFQQTFGLEGTGVQEALDGLNPDDITGVNKPSLSELNAGLAGGQYRLRARPEPWDGEVRGYVLEDLKRNDVVWWLQTDNEELACLLTNIRLLSFKEGKESSRLEAFRIWGAPIGRPN